jgi:transcriptional regulator with AAA-type ATPase domain
LPIINVKKNNELLEYFDNIKELKNNISNYVFKYNNKEIYKNILKNDKDQLNEYKKNLYKLFSI